VTRLLVLRPEPGASETAARAKRLGLEPIVAPIFTVRALAWAPPDPAGIDAVLLTSANAARLGGSGLERLRHLPCYAVGEATGAAARAAGFDDVKTGDSDGAAAVSLARNDGMCRLLHICGREHNQLVTPGVEVTPVVAYAADPVSPLPKRAAEAVGQRALVLLHSARAASLFATLVDGAGIPRGAVRLASISAAAAEAAGSGWREIATAAQPRDEALL